MTLSIPDEIIQATGMSEDDLLLELAVLLFQKERLTLAQASRLVGMPRLRFQQLLASRQIPIHYDVDELEADIRTLRSLGQL
jgi:predicted HTH domain antitoxin